MICDRCKEPCTKTFKRGEGLSVPVLTGDAKKDTKLARRRALYVTKGKRRGPKARLGVQNVCQKCVAKEPVHLVRESRKSYAYGEKEDFDGGDGMMSVVLLFPDRSTMAFPIAEAFR
jgi:hypothetical protein